ncbi:MAG: hypothetical protein J6S85_05015 [Methanobrevibacter sp.]|nr:hypothetical protein [Methanobrevibacter sp.]
MAYNIYNGVRKLVVSFNGQSEDTIENIQSAQFDSASNVGNLLRSNPYYFMPIQTEGYTNWGPSEAAIYAQLEAIPSGTLSIKTLLSMVSAGQYIKIYRQGFPNTYLYFTKPSGSTFEGCSIYLYYNGSRIATDFGTYLGVNWGVQQTSRVYSIGFLYDSNLDKFALYTINIGNPITAGSYGNCIKEIAGIAVSADSTQISNIQAALDVLLRGNIVPEPPYGNDDYTTSTGGNGNHDDSSDTIAESTLPSIGASSSGFCTAYVPTIAQIQELAERLTDPNILQALGNTVLNISDVVIGLHVLPVAVPKETSTRQVCINFLGIGVPAGVYIDKATTQFVEVDCGSLNITEYWGNCVDYNPYTQIGIFLPFCGFYELDTDDVMGKTIAVSYRVDIMSGACLATIKVDGSVLYQYTGDCANQIPVNSVNFDNFLTNAFNMAIATSTGGAGLAAAGASSASSLEGIRTSDASSKAKQLAKESVLANYDNVTAQTLGHMGGATVGAVMGAKGQYKHAGCLAGSPGFLGVRKPYLIIKRPEQIIPGNYGKYHGYPSNTGAILGDLSGYTVVDEIRLNIPNATVDEILECEKLLKGGVVI